MYAQAMNGIIQYLINAKSAFIQALRCHIALNAMELIVAKNARMGII